jgi:hypothetical protein
MDLGFYAILIALAAFVYSGIARYIQMKLVNKNEMKTMQEESKRLNEEFKKAKESGDKARMDELLKQQMELLPKINKMMLAQLKPMFVIIIVFIAFNYVISYFNPEFGDDTVIQLSDDGKNCDSVAGDRLFSGCFAVNGTQYGKWAVHIKASDAKSEIGKNSIFFRYNSEANANPYVEPASGEWFNASLDKQVYYPGDKVTLYANAPARATAITATIDAGTTFYVDLPITLPLINVQRIYGTNWWFIFVALIAGLMISFGVGQLEKRGMIK